MTRVSSRGTGRCTSAPTVPGSFSRSFSSRYRHEPAESVVLSFGGCTGKRGGRDGDRPGIVVGARTSTGRTRGLLPVNSASPWHATPAPGWPWLVIRSAATSSARRMKRPGGKSGAAQTFSSPPYCASEKSSRKREAGVTEDVVRRQLDVLAGLDAAGPRADHRGVRAGLGDRTGRNATPEDAARVHASVRAWFSARGVPARSVTVLLVEV